MARVARALIEPTDKGKVPFVYVVMIYIIPATVLIGTQAVWQLFIPAVAIHLLLRWAYKKDQHFVRYFFMELKTPDRFEP